MYRTKSLAYDYNMGYKNIFYSLILERITGKADMNILDIGCKGGADLLYICNGRDFKGYGLDIKYGETWINRQQSNVHFLQGMGERLPFKENVIDIIIASEVIEHISEADDFLNEVYRVLKPDSHFFITTPPRYSYTGLVGKFVPSRFKKSLRKLIWPNKNEMNGIKQILPNGTIVREHVHEYIPWELKRLLKGNGFEVEVIQQGSLAIPLAPLFDRFPYLIKLWKIFDDLISKFPFSIHLKLNFIVMAKKSDKEYTNY